MWTVLAGKGPYNHKGHEGAQGFEIVGHRREAFKFQTLSRTVSDEDVSF